MSTLLTRKDCPHSSGTCPIFHTCGFNKMNAAKGKIIWGHRLIRFIQKYLCIVLECIMYQFNMKIFWFILQTFGCNFDMKKPEIQALQSKIVLYSNTAQLQPCNKWQIQLQIFSSLTTLPVRHYFLTSWSECTPTQFHFLPLTIPEQDWFLGQSSVQQQLQASGEQSD